MLFAVEIKKEIGVGFLLYFSYMKKKYYIPLGGILIIICIAVGFATHTTLTAKHNFLSQHADGFDSDTINNDTMFTFATTSPGGFPVTIAINPCDTEYDVQLCFGSGASNEVMISNRIFVDLISSSSQINFGIQDTIHNKAFIVKVDFEGKVYAENDYKYYRSILPQLFSLWEDRK